MTEPQWRYEVSPDRLAPSIIHELAHSREYPGADWNDQEHRCDHYQ
jgi:hypothetical protein